MRVQRASQTVKLKITGTEPNTEELHYLPLCEVALFQQQHPSFSPTFRSRKVPWRNWYHAMLLIRNMTSQGGHVYGVYNKNQG